MRKKKKSASKKRSQNVRSVKNHIEFWPYIFCSICWCTLCFHKLCLEIEENWLGCDGCASLHGFNKRLYRAPSQSWFWRLELSGIWQRETYCENLKSLDVTFQILTESLDRLDISARSTKPVHLYATAKANGPKIWGRGRTTCLERLNCQSPWRHRETPGEQPVVICSVIYSVICSNGLKKQDTLLWKVNWRCFLERGRRLCSYGTHVRITRIEIERPIQRIARPVAKKL